MEKEITVREAESFVEWYNSIESYHEKVDNDWLRIILFFYYKKMREKLKKITTSEEFINWFLYYYEKVKSFWINDPMWYLLDVCRSENIYVRKETLHDIKSFIC